MPLFILSRYSIPFLQILKGLFCKKVNFFQHFSPEPQGQQQNIRQQLRRLPHNPAQQQEIQPRRQPRQKQAPQAEFSATGQHVQQVHSARDPQPEGQVKQGGKGFVPQSPAKGAQKLVHKPCRQPQGQGQQGLQRLGLHPGVHQRSRRAKKPPVFGACSSRYSRPST